MTRARRRGFSLIEISLAVTALILLSLLAWSATACHVPVARAVARKVEADRIASAVALWRFDHAGEAPPSTEALRGLYFVSATTPGR